DQLIGVLLQLLEARAAEVEFEIGLAHAAAAEGAYALHAGAEVGIFLKHAARVGHHLELSVIALREIGQPHVDIRGRDVPLTGLDVAGRVADRRHDIGHAAQFGDAALELAHQAVAFRQRIAAGGLDDDFELALVVGGNESFADRGKQRHDPEDREDAGGDHDPAVAQRPAQDPAVGYIDPGIEPAIL